MVLSRLMRAPLRLTALAQAPTRWSLRPGASANAVTSGHSAGKPAPAISDRQSRRARRRACPTRARGPEFKISVSISMLRHPRKISIEKDQDLHRAMYGVIADRAPRLLVRDGETVAVILSPED